MTITQLHYVLAVAEHANFTNAAEKCFVTQPTLSMQVQKLEEELDVQIFDRSKKPIKLTEVGEKIVKQAKIIINETNRVKDIVEHQKGFIGGTFSIGVIPTVMPTLLPMFLKAFTKKYPKVKLKIEELSTKDIIKKINSGHLDAAIAATPLETDFIKERVIYYEPFVGYVPNGHALYDKQKLEISDLDINEILLLEDGHCFRDGVINICNANRSINFDNFQLQSGSIEMLVKLANEGLGMTLLPYLHTLDLKASEQDNLTFFEEPHPSREVSLIYNKNELKLHIIDALYNIISGVVRGAIAFQNVKIISPLSKVN